MRYQFRGMPPIRMNLMLWNLCIAEPLSFAEAPAEYPNENSNTSCPPPRHAFFFFLPASLRHKEASAEERVAELLESHISCHATYPQYTFENQLSWTRLSGGFRGGTRRTRAPLIFRPNWDLKNLNFLAESPQMST